MVHESRISGADGSNSSYEQSRNLVSQERQREKEQKNRSLRDPYNPKDDPCFSFFKSSDEAQETPMTTQEMKDRFFISGISGSGWHEKEWSILQEIRQKQAETIGRLKAGARPSDFESRDYWDKYKDTDKPVCRAHFNEYLERKEQEERHGRYLTLNACAKAERAKNNEARLKAKYDALVKTLSQQKSRPLLGRPIEPQVDLETGKRYQIDHVWLHPENASAIAIEADVLTDIKGARHQRERGDFLAMQRRVEHALKLAEHLNYEPLIALCQYYLGIALYYQDKCQEADNAFNAAWKCQGHYPEGATLDKWRKRVRDALQSDSSPSPNNSNKAVEAKLARNIQEQENITSTAPISGHKSRKMGKLSSLPSPIVGERPGMSLNLEPIYDNPGVFAEVNVEFSSPNQADRTSSGLPSGWIKHGSDLQNLGDEIGNKTLIEKREHGPYSRSSGLDTNGLVQYSKDKLEGKIVGNKAIRVKEVVNIERATMPQPDRIQPPTAAQQANDKTRLTMSNKVKLDRDPQGLDADNIRPWLDNEGEIFRKQRESSWTYNGPDASPVETPAVKGGKMLTEEVPPPAQPKRDPNRTYPRGPAPPIPIHRPLPKALREKAIQLSIKPDPQDSPTAVNSGTSEAPRFERDGNGEVSEPTARQRRKTQPGKILLRVDTSVADKDRLVGQIPPRLSSPVFSSPTAELTEEGQNLAGFERQERSDDAESGGLGARGQWNGEQKRAYSRGRTWKRRQ